MKRFFLPFNVFLAILLFFQGRFVAFADVISVKASYPDFYIVKKGDTLWDISAFFLDKPWHWPQLWGENPQIVNPHLIYPGDKLFLTLVDGKPKLTVKRYLTKKVQGRISVKNNAVPAINLSLIRPYLTQNRVVDADWFKQQPMIIGSTRTSRHYAAGDIIFIKGQLSISGKVGLYTKGRRLNRADNGEKLGVEATLAAVGRVIESGDISKVEILNSYRETKAGDRVLDISEDLYLNAYFMPKPTQVNLPTKILTSTISIREMGKLDIAYIDRGQLDGVIVGDVFAIYREGNEVLMGLNGQPIAYNTFNAFNQLVSNIENKRTVKYSLPSIYHGSIMVFKVFDKTSVGIIMNSERAVRANDNLISPEVYPL